MVPETGVFRPCCAGMFLIDLERRIRLSMKYSSHVGKQLYLRNHICFALILIFLNIFYSTAYYSLGRNLYEVLRYYDALDTTINHKVVTPCNWGQGQDVFINNEVPIEQTKQYRYFEMKPWFKLTPCPENNS